MGDALGAAALFDERSLHQIRGPDIWVMALRHHEVSETGRRIIE
jgi:hypothetical protein